MMTASSGNCKAEEEEEGSLALKKTVVEAFADSKKEYGPGARFPRELGPPNACRLLSGRFRMSTAPFAGFSNFIEWAGSDGAAAALLSHFNSYVRETFPAGVDKAGAGGAGEVDKDEAEKCHSPLRLMAVKGYEKVGTLITL